MTLDPENEDLIFTKVWPDGPSHTLSLPMGLMEAYIIKEHLFSPKQGEEILLQGPRGWRIQVQTDALIFHRSFSTPSKDLRNVFPVLDGIPVMGLDLEELHALKRVFPQDETSPETAVRVEEWHLTDSPICPSLSDLHERMCILEWLLSRVKKELDKIQGTVVTHL